MNTEAKGSLVQQNVTNSLPETVVLNHTLVQDGRYEQQFSWLALLVEDSAVTIERRHG